VVKETKKRKSIAQRSARKGRLQKLRIKREEDDRLGKKGRLTREQNKKEGRRPLREGTLGRRIGLTVR